MTQLRKSDGSELEHAGLSALARVLGPTPRPPVPLGPSEALDKRDFNPPTRDQPLAVDSRVVVEIPQREELLLTAEALVPGEGRRNTGSPIAINRDCRVADLMMGPAKYRLATRNPLANRRPTHNVTAAARAIVGAGIIGERCHHAIEIVRIEPVAIPSE
jgi:hypothetical protein